MNVKRFDSTDYELICEWWKDYGWNPVPIQSLPTTGFVVNNICAGFLYKTDSNIAWLEFVISDKNAEWEDKQLALDTLINRLCEEAKKDNYNIIFTSCKHDGLISKYINNGFNKTDLEMTNLIRSL